MRNTYSNDIGDIYKVKKLSIQEKQFSQCLLNLALVVSMSAQEKFIIWELSMLHLNKDQAIKHRNYWLTQAAFDLDAYIYIDTIIHTPVSVFSKRKISSTIGGANKNYLFQG